MIVGQHSDGAVGRLFPDLIEIGLQVFNPLSPTIMDPAEYKAKCGDRLTFYGGIDVERLMPFGTPDEVRAEIRRMAGADGPGRRLHPAELAHHAGRRAHGEHRRVHRGGARDGRAGVIVTVTLNPTLDKTLSVPVLRPGEVHHARFLRQDIGGKGINVSRRAGCPGGGELPDWVPGRRHRPGDARRAGRGRLRCTLRGSARRRRDRT